MGRGSERRMVEGAAIQQTLAREPSEEELSRLGNLLEALQKGGL
jgi:hypothetical protein